MGNIKNEVFLGTREMQNKKFELLAKMAQPEIWTYKKICLYSFFEKLA